MEIKARMPGQIVDIKVKTGDAVQVKSILGTVEAMKMAQPVPCPAAGTVKEILVNVGDKVKAGQVMFVVE
ncbi:MAG: biotin/lipoyl-binding protein [Oscillospiraceae bacterium]|nr:biotin/lipoyl-binding protein [Oscillospiraceae bacterium]